MEDVGLCYCGESGNWVINPFAEEIYHEENWEFMCDFCYGQALDDI